MKLEDQSKRLNEAIHKLIKARKETDLEMSKLRTSQKRLEGAVEKLIPKIDKFIRFEETCKYQTHIIQ